MGTRIKQILPPNIRAALVANPSSPSAGNAFVTFADLTGGDGIYGGSGTTPSNVTATITDDLLFALPTVSDRFAVGPSGLTLAASIHFESKDATGFIVEGSNGTDGDFALRIFNNGRTVASALFENNGDVILCPTPLLASSRLTIGTSTPLSSSLMTVRGADLLTTTPTALFTGSTGVTTLQVQNDGRVGIGDLATATRFNIKGTGTTSATTQLNVINSVGAITMRSTDNTHIGFGGAPLTTFRANFTAGSSLAGMINISASNMLANASAINIASASTVGNVRGIAISVDQATGAFDGTGVLVTAYALNGRDNIGLQGLARNADRTNIGVDGQIPGGDTVNPSTFAAAVRGLNNSVAATDKRGGFFVTGSTVDGSTTYAVYAQGAGVGDNVTNYGIFALGQGNNVTGGLNVAGHFAATGTSPTLIAIRVPAASGQVLIGALLPINATAIMEITGKMEIIGSANGLIYESPDASRFITQMTNAGTLVIAAA